jgi:hypothetical protein
MRLADEEAGCFELKETSGKSIPSGGLRSYDLMRMCYPFFIPVHILTLLIFPATSGADDRGKLLWGHLPKNFDPPFAPQNIDPDTATISPSPGFEQGRYEIRISLSETTLYDRESKPTRNYKGEFILQSLKLPTDDFKNLAGRSFEQVADDFSSSWIELRQYPRRDEKIQTPFAQHYPVIIKSVRFGQVQRHAIYMEVTFHVDFAAGGPPNPWWNRAAITPYHLALEQMGNPGYPEEEWKSFCALVKETNSIWGKAKYLTNVRVLLNHRYQSSSNMNTHER